MMQYIGVHPPLTANKSKTTTSLLDGAFLLLICPAPPQAAGGCASVSEQIPERGGLSAGSPAGGCASEVSKSRREGD